MRFLTPTFLLLQFVLSVDTNGITINEINYVNPTDFDRKEFIELKQHFPDGTLLDGTDEMNLKNHRLLLIETCKGVFFCMLSWMQSYLWLLCLCLFLSIRIINRLNRKQWIN
ncbi:MAG: hypothetical protein GY861_15215 [bacterium]|nr:hypothetical protein [bacterium]